MYIAVGGESPTVYRFVSPARIEIVPKALESEFFDLPTHSHEY